MESINLSDLKEGEKARIVGFNTEEVPVKFYEIGVVPGNEILVYKKAPFNGPICFTIGNEEGKLALGKNEAACVVVEMTK